MIRNRRSATMPICASAVALGLLTGSVAYLLAPAPIAKPTAMVPSITIIDNGATTSAKDGNASGTDAGASSPSSGKAAKTDEGILYFADPSDPSSPIQLHNIIPGYDNGGRGEHPRRFPGEPPTGPERVAPGGGGGTTSPPPFTVAEATAQILSLYPTAKLATAGGDCGLVNSGGWSEGSNPPPPYVARIGPTGWIGYIVTVDGNEGLVSWYGCYPD